MQKERSISNSSFTICMLHRLAETRALDPTFITLDQILEAIAVKFMTEVGCVSRRAAVVLV